jgi:hypothetical protein
MCSAYQSLKTMCKCPKQRAALLAMPAAAAAAPPLLLLVLVLRKSASAVMSTLCAARCITPSCVSILSTCRYSSGSHSTCSAYECLPLRLNAVRCSVLSHKQLACWALYCVKLLHFTMNLTLLQCAMAAHTVGCN